MLAIGIDIGGTKMAVAAVEVSGLIADRVVLPTDAGQGFERAVERLSQAIDGLLRRRGVTAKDLAGIGIGCAGPVDPIHGLINNPYTLEGWNRCDIVTPLRERFGVPVFLENDADAAAMGECFVGAGRGFSPVVMLTFGTGIGGGAVVDGRIYRGANGEHPELGHIPVDPAGPECYCGLRGCLESLASGSAIAAAGQAFGCPDARAVFAGAAEGNVQAVAVIERALAAGATGAWTICHTLLPRRLILGGGIMDDHFEAFAGAMTSKLAAATQFTREGIEIVRAVLGNDAGLVGAASLAFSAAQ